MLDMRRRKFITLLGGTAALPLAARGQQASSPVVALLSSCRLPESLIGIFRQGLAEQGYVEGRNVVIDYRHGDNQYERLAGLAAEFARRQVAVIAALNSPPALAARAATTTIPIVFMIPDDPVKLGLAVSLSRPGEGDAATHLVQPALVRSEEVGVVRRCSRSPQPIPSAS